MIDLATVSPIDFDTIARIGARRPAACVIIHEAPRNCGVGAEIAATVAEKAIYSLKAPIERVTGYDIPMPLFKLEHDYMPSVERVLKGIRTVLEA